MLAGDADDFLGILGQRAVDARHHRHARLLHRVLRAHLVAHQAYGFRPRPDEHEAALLHALGKVGVFRKEAVAGMDRLGIGHLRRADDGGNIEIAVRRLRRPDAHRFVGEFHVLGFGIGLGMDDDGLDAHLAAGALDAQGDFAAVGDQDLLKHSGKRLREKEKGGKRQRRAFSGPLAAPHASPSTNSGWPYSTGWPFSASTALMMPS